jgi:hypothetical protein
VRLICRRIELDQSKRRADLRAHTTIVFDGEMKADGSSKEFGGALCTKLKEA